MLIEFRVENHRSLRDEQVLTMEAGRVGDESDSRPRKVHGYPEKLLPVAGLYGPNASGKSNVLSALEFMRNAVLVSHRLWAPDEGIPRDPFAWGTTKNEPSLFEVILLIEGVRFQYGFVASDECFLEEWLYAWPKGHKQTWFERDANSYKYGEHFKGENKLIEEVTRPNALFVSAAVQHNHPCLHPILSCFRSLQPLNMPLRRPNSGFRYRMSSPYELARLLEEGGSHQMTLFPDEEYSKRISDKFRELLIGADIGIVDYRVDVEIHETNTGRAIKVPHFYLKHNSISDNAWLPLEEESNGTKTLFGMVLPILNTIENGGILFIDELERSLHPHLARKIIGQFNNPEANPRNAQLIFTTHDTNLLGTMIGEPALRRDQVWLTEKNEEGATELYPLTDYKPRKGENVERGYLQGRYGAIPFVENFSVAGE